MGAMSENYELTRISRGVRNLAISNGVNSFLLLAVAHAYHAPLWVSLWVLGFAVAAMLPAVHSPWQVDLRWLSFGMDNACIPSYSTSPASGDTAL